MQLFFSTNIKNNVIILDKVETHHCMNVLRHSIGDDVSIVDGRGNFYKGSIFDLKNKVCFIKINETVFNFDKKTHYIHIAISPLKNHDRIEWFVEKAVEIGIDEISFIHCSRTVRKKIRINRLQRISETAIKQTIKATLPKINPLIHFNDFIENSNFNSQFICHLESKVRNDIYYYKKDVIKDKKSCILIGPEGDFDSQEIDLAIDRKFKPLSLGPSRLRTETAGIVACHLLNLINCIK